MLVLLIK